MSSEKKVSIITPLFNAEKYIAQTIQSVTNQTHQEWEMIIVNDCSTDGGPTIVEQQRQLDERIKLIHNKKNMGPAHTRNQGIMAATGRYIAFLDSDDLWLPHKLEAQLKFMENNKAPFTFAYYEQMDEEENFLKKMDYFPSRVDYRSTMKSNKIGCLTAMYDKKYFGKVYMADIGNREDYTLWLQLLKKVRFAHCVPEILARYRIRKGSMSSNKWKLVRYHWHIYRIEEKQSFFQSLYYITNYIILRLTRK